MEKSVYQNTEISVNVDMILFQVMYFEQNLSYGWGEWLLWFECIYSTYF